MARRSAKRGGCEVVETAAVVEEDAINEAPLDLLCLHLDDIAVDLRLRFSRTPGRQQRATKQHSDERDDMYDVLDDEYDDPRRADQLSHRMKKVAYPPRLMVDFTSLGMEALKRYAQFYNLSVREELGKSEVAALVARHFDGTLEVEEDDSIVSFIQRIRNGERNANKRSLADKERKNSEKKRKKSNSRKRQREGSAATGASGVAGAASSSAGAAGGSHSGSAAAGGSARENGAFEERKAAAAAAASASSSGAAAAAAPTHKSATHKRVGAKEKKKDNGEDNELYCICNLPSYGNMIACDGKKCPNPSQWYHLECVGFSDGRHPDTWLCPECDPKGFAASQGKKKKSSSSKQRSKSPGSSK
ncbi:hypothetical protein PybrP1_001445 [[Pythium] brassicae (nom. inval.)]|nr:hypothetical protein PybrP1_001445 [[Pythium] brassicae (nom. inval.)]